MRSLTIRSVNRTKGILFGLSCSCIILLLFFHFVDFYSLKASLGERTVILYAGISVAFFIPIWIFERVFVKTWHLSVLHGLLNVRSKGMQEVIPLSQLSVIRFKETASGTTCQWYDISQKKILGIVVQNNEPTPKEIIDLFVEHINLIKRDVYMTNKIGVREYEYLNKDAVDSLPLQKIRTNKKRRMIIGACMATVGVLTLIFPFLFRSHSYAGYEIKGDKVFFGKEEMAGVKATQFRTLTLNVALDSSRVFFRGKPVDYVDRNTFKFVGGIDRIYSDKNGLYYEYYEKGGFFSMKSGHSTLIPLKGTYDKATLKRVMLGESLYADKNQLYTFESSEDPPLKPVEIDGLDIGSLEAMDVNDEWLRDKNHVYFYNRHMLRACPEIDRSSFQVLSSVAAKDKNQVYYITFLLSSKDTKGTKNFDYAILKGADAASFERIDDRTYRDKNTEWTIQHEGETTSTNVPEGRKK